MVDLPGNMDFFAEDEDLGADATDFVGEGGPSLLPSDVEPFVM